MRRNVELIEGIVDRETQRLARRGRTLKARLRDALERYPEAEQFVDEVDKAVGADEAFSDRLRHRGWKRDIEALGEQWREVVDGVGEGDALVLCWDGDYGVFRIEDQGGRWQRRRREGCIDVDEVVDELVEGAGRERVEGREVTYPILSGHQLAANHRAIARRVGWALVVAAIGRHMEEVGRPEQVFLRGGVDGEDVELSGHTAPVAESIPPASAFGFCECGELFRRIDEFDEVDPGAHCRRWVKDRRRAPKELRVLRDRTGARHRVELDRRLRRLRIAEQPGSTVVRKRHHVFVDPGAMRSRDRYFATEKALDSALVQCLKSRIEAGFRIVSEQFDS